LKRATGFSNLMQGYQLKEDLISFVNELKELQNVVALLVENENLEEVKKVTSASIGLFFQIMNKQDEETPAIVTSTLNILEKGEDLLNIIDAIEYLEVLPFMYEAVRREISIHVLYTLEKISFRHYPHIDFYPVVFSLLCQLDMHQLALEELDSQGSKDDAYWNNRAALKAKLGLFKEALLCYDLALSIRPHPLYYANKARIYESLNQLPECIDLLNKSTTMLKEDWFENNQYDPLEAKTIIYMIYQNKLGAFYEYYHSTKDQNNSNSEKMKLDLLDCIAQLVPYSEGNEKFKESLEKIRKSIENNETVNELLYRPTQRASILCNECNKKDIYNLLQVPSFSACGNCRSVVYCSKECQKKNWPNHKEFCKRVEFILKHQQHKKQFKQKMKKDGAEEQTSLNPILQSQNKHE